MYQMTPPKPPEKGKKGLSFFQMLLGCCGAGICGLVPIYHLCAGGIALRDH